MANKSYIRKTINDFEKYCTHRYPDNAELSALWDYVIGYTTSLNDILRYYSIPDDISKVSNSVINETIKESITNLDNAFNSEFASTGIIDVFRTIDKEALEKAYGITGDNIDNYVGRVISDCGYMSTSSECISPWSGEAKWMDNEVVLHITSTIPMNYLDINKIFRNSEIDCNEQKECLLQRNLKLEIKSYTCRSGLVKYDKKKCICFIEAQIVNRKISESKNMKNTKKALYESIMMVVAKEVKKALNESSKSYEDAEAKMDAWHNGIRKQNVKACSDDKLRMNLQICLDKGYTKEAKILQNEIDERSSDSIIEGLGITKSKLVKLFKKQNWDFDEDGDEVYWDYNGITKTRAILCIQNHDLDDEILDCPDLKFEIEFEFKFDNNQQFVGFDILNIDVTDAYSPEIVFIKNFSEVEDFIYSHWFNSIKEILHIMGY